jgi:hypothetical protein
MEENKIETGQNSISLTFKKNFNLRCSVCQEILEIKKEESFYTRNEMLLVEPCQKCFKNLAEFNKILKQFIEVMK